VDLTPPLYFNPLHHLQARLAVVLGGLEKERASEPVHIQTDRPRIHSYTERERERRGREEREREYGDREGLVGAVGGDDDAGALREPQSVRDL
jgi:hypothetical protein